MKGMSIHINMFSILMIMHFLMGSIIPCYGENVSKEADMIQSDTLVFNHGKTKCAYSQKRNVFLMSKTKCVLKNNLSHNKRHQD